MGDHRVQPADLLHLTDVVKVGSVQPSEVLALKFGREGIVLINRSVLDLVHLVELTLEKNELLARLRLGVDNTLLILLKSIDDLHEVTLSHKELEVLRITLFYSKISTEVSKNGLELVNDLRLMVSIGMRRPSCSKYSLSASV